MQDQHENASFYASQSHFCGDGIDSIVKHAVLPTPIFVTVSTPITNIITSRFTDVFTINNQSHFHQQTHNFRNTGTCFTKSLGSLVSWLLVSAICHGEKNTGLESYVKPKPFMNHFPFLPLPVCSVHITSLVPLYQNISSLLKFKVEFQGFNRGPNTS